MEFILKYRKHFIIGGILSLFLVGLIIIYYFNPSAHEQEKVVTKTETIVKNENTNDKNNDETDAIITTEYYVDIKGAINNPGVYKLTSNSIVNDVVTIAGGITENGDTTCINLSKKITDEMVIYIYTKQEVDEMYNEEEKIDTICNNIVNDAYVDYTNPENSNNELTNNEVPVFNKVNINTANLELLITLPNIGESKAHAILSMREEKGKFNSIDEIKEVSGIGESTFEKIKDLITVE